jgi:hypothetical protein
MSDACFSDSESDGTSDAGDEAPPDDWVDIDTDQPWDSIESDDLESPKGKN